MSRLLAVLVVVMACDHDASGPPATKTTGPAPTLVTPAPPPAPAKPKRRVVPRSELESWIPQLPKRGVFWVAMGLSSHGPAERRVVVDVDARTFETRGDEYPKPAVKVRTLAQDDADVFWKLAEAAWQAPPPPEQHVTDYREVLVAVDGDDAMMISSQGPLQDSSPASELAGALRGAAGW